MYSYCYNFSLTLLLAGLFGMPVMVQAADRTVIAQVVWVKGELKATDAQHKTRILERRAPIYQNDTLSTDAKSTAEIVFSDTSLLSLREASQMRIDHYSFNSQAPHATDSKQAMTLLKGGFRTLTGLIPKANADNYQINTPVATIGVRGTEYSTVYTNKLYLKYYKGAPCVTNNQGEVCATSAVPYAIVPSAVAAPQPTTVEPAVFKLDMKLASAKFEASGNDSTSSTASTSSADGAKIGVMTGGVSPPASPPVAAPSSAGCVPAG